jgi:hypothetical protein
MEQVMSGITFQASDIPYADLKERRFRINAVKTHVIFSGTVKAEPGGRRGVSLSLRGNHPPTEIGLATIDLPLSSSTALATYTLPTVFIRLVIGDDPEFIHPNADYILEVDALPGSNIDTDRCSFCIMES